MSKRAVLYGRVSSDDTRNDGRNLTSQLQMCREYALEHFSVNVLTEKRMSLWQNALTTDKFELKNDLS